MRKLRPKRWNNLLKTPWLITGEPGFIPGSFHSPPPSELHSRLRRAVFERETLLSLSIRMSVATHQKTTGKRYVDVCLWLWHPPTFAFRSSGTLRVSSSWASAVKKKWKCQMMRTVTALLKKCESMNQVMLTTATHTPVRHHHALPDLTRGVCIGKRPHNSLLFELY